MLRAGGDGRGVCVCVCVCVSGPTHVRVCMHTPAGMNAACLSEAPVLRSEHCVVVKTGVMAT